MNGCSLVSRVVLTLAISFHAIFCKAESFFVYKPLNEANIQQASRELTEEESTRLKKYLHDRIEAAKENGDFGAQEQAKLEAIINEFYRGRYDLVIQGMFELGYRPEQVLGTTGLRTAMLAAQLEHTPWFLREIAGLDWFFERDSKRASKHKQWPQVQDKINYILSLADQIERNHMRIIDRQMMGDALSSLITRINMLMPKLPDSMRSKAQEMLERLEKLQHLRIKSYESAD